MAPEETSRAGGGPSGGASTQQVDAPQRRWPGRGLSQRGWRVPGPDVCGKAQPWMCGARMLALGVVRDPGWGRSVSPSLPLLQGSWGVGRWRRDGDAEGAPPCSHHGNCTLPSWVMPL